jgi:PAP2 superfamily
MKRSVVVGSCVLIGLSVAQSQASGPDAILLWNGNAGKAAVASCLAPEGNALAESRMYAMVHIAMHDALNAIERRSRPYAFDARAARRTSADAAIAAAARDVLVAVIGQLQESPTCIENGTASVEADYAAALADIHDGRAKERGIALGQAAARAIVTLRAGDGSDTLLADPNYPQGTQPGDYRFTAGTPFAFAPGWGNVTPFALRDGSQFRAGPPYRIDSRRYTADFNEVKSVGGGGATPTTRTPEQTEIGLFWVESSPFAWNRLARSISRRFYLGIHANARLFGLLNMAMADGYIGSWEGKYHYNFWRPETAIQRGDSDGNPDTVGDPGWTPFHFTYPMPDHDSAHSVEGGAAAEVLKQFFGTDRIPFRACSMTLPAGSRCTDATPRLRRYRSFSAAANENALSRILIGIHFRRAVDEGVEHGRKIGRFTVARYMRPVHD